MAASTSSTLLLSVRTRGFGEGASECPAPTRSLSLVAASLSAGPLLVGGLRDKGADFDGRRARGKGEDVRRSSSVEAPPSRLRNAQATVPLFGKALCVLLVHAHLWPLSPFRQWLIGAPRPLALLPSLPSPLPRILVLFPSARCLWPRGEGCARRCWPRPIEGAHETRALDEIREVRAVPYLSLPHSPMRVGCPALLGRKLPDPESRVSLALVSSLKDSCPPEIQVESESGKVNRCGTLSTMS